MCRESTWRAIRLWVEPGGLLGPGGQQPGGPSGVGNLGVRWHPAVNLGVRWRTSFTGDMRHNLGVRLKLVK